MSKEEISIIANAINMIHNPVYNLEGTIYGSINIGEFFDKNLLHIYLFVESALGSTKDEGVATGIYSPYKLEQEWPNYYKFGLNEILAKGLALTNNNILYDLAMRMLTETIAHELGHAVMSQNYYPEFWKSNDLQEEILGRQVSSGVSSRLGFKVMRALERLLNRKR